MMCRGLVLPGMRSFGARCGRSRSRPKSGSSYGDLRSTRYLLDRFYNGVIWLIRRNVRSDILQETRGDTRCLTVIWPGVFGP